MNEESAKYTAIKTAKMTAISRAEDRGESIAEMEPLLIGETSRFRGPLTDLAVELVQKSARFRGSLPESLLASLADLVPDEALRHARELLARVARKA